MNAPMGAIRDIRRAADRFIAEAEAETLDQWLFRPEPSAWSMAHIAEHVALANGNLHAVLAKGLLNDHVLTRSTDVLDDEIPYLFYRGDEPPNLATPSGQWIDLPKALESVRKSSMLILEWVDSVSFDLRKVGVPHPMFGLMDGVQWLLFAAAHMERHRAQLIGLKRHDGFPVRQ